MLYNGQDAYFRFSPMRKIYTCTPISFHADERFWIRDTGLICDHLRFMGVESKCVLCLPNHDNDVRTEHVLRVTPRELRSVSWWKQQQLDGVVLYSWALPQFLLIARAVHSAGIPFSIHWDGGGDLLPRPNSAWCKRIYTGIKFRIMDYLRAKHLSYANHVTIAPSVCRFLCARSVYQRAHLAEKAVASPCPVSREFNYEGREKENLIIAIGRWDDEKQKRARFLMQTLQRYYQANHGNTATEIYGTITPELQAWHAGMPTAVRELISLKGYLANAMLKDVYQRARIICCTSSHESSHIVSAEALCCGCSVVVTNLPKTLSVLHWYTTRQSGRISEQDTPESLAQALLDENKAWASGERNPESISSYWKQHFHADKVYAGIFNLK